MFFETADEYVAWDITEKWEYFEETGRRKWSTDPPHEWFPSEDIHTEAIRSRMIVCTKPDHIGDRCLRPDQFYHDVNRACKECERRKKRKPLSCYTSATEWAAAHHPASNPTPKAAEFPDPAEYQAALQLHVQQRKAYKKSHNERYDVRKRKNANRRRNGTHATDVEEDAA